MWYYEKELEEMTEENWDGKFREMLVWNDDSTCLYKAIVIGYIQQDNCWITSRSCRWQHCADIPKEKPKIKIKTEYDFVENMLKAPTKD